MQLSLIILGKSGPVRKIGKMIFAVTYKRQKSEILKFVYLYRVTCFYSTLLKYIYNYIDMDIRLLPDPLGLCVFLARVANLLQCYMYLFCCVVCSRPTTRQGQVKLKVR